MQLPPPSRSPLLPVLATGALLLTISLPRALGGESLTPAAARQRLIEGNRHFISGKLDHPHQDPRYRHDLSRGQHPFATVIACADSRVPPEILFDEGLGDLFVIRTAGHVLDEAVLGTLEYAVKHLRTPLIVVLGHENCGAVTAAVRPGEHPEHLEHLVEAIRPAARLARIPHHDDQEEVLVHRAVLHHVRLSAEALPRRSDLIRRALERGELEISGAVYDLADGIVGFLPPR